MIQVLFLEDIDITYYRCYLIAWKLGRMNADERNENSFIDKFMEKLKNAVRQYNK